MCVTNVTPGVYVLCYCRLPEGVMVNEDTKLARWDHSKKIWRTGGISDIKIDVGQSLITLIMIIQLKN